MNLIAIIFLQCVLMLKCCYIYESDGNYVPVICTLLLGLRRLTQVEMYHHALYLHQMLSHFLFRFYGPFKNISLTSSQSFIKGGRKLENPGKKPPDHPSAEPGFPTCDPSKARTTNAVTYMKLIVILFLQCLLTYKWYNIYESNRNHLPVICTYTRVL